MRGSGDRIAIRVLACSSCCSENVALSTTRTIYACCPVDRCFASCRLSTVYRSVDRWLIIASPRDEIYYESKRHFVNICKCIIIAMLLVSVFVI